MDKVRLTATQFSAYTLTSLVEPLPRGFMLTSTSESQLSAIFGVDPDAEYPQELSMDSFSQIAEDTIVLTVLNEHGLEAAGRDAEVILGRLDGIRLAAVILVYGESMVEFPGEEQTTLAAATASLPTSLGRPTELEVWAPTRSRDFAPVEPSTVAPDPDTIVEPWLHSVVTGRRPDQEQVAAIAAAIGDTDVRDRLLLSATMLAFDDLDERSSSDEIMSALMGRNGRPQGKRLVTAALTAQYIAAHTDDMPAASRLYALASLMLWSEARARAALHAAETALLYDRSCSLASTSMAVVTGLMYPSWFTA